MSKTHWKYFYSIIYIGIFSSIIFVIVGSDYLKNEAIPEQQYVDFKIQTEFDNYIELQKLWIKAEIINNTSKDYLLSTAFSIYKGIRFEIQDGDGKKYNQYMDLHLVASSDTLKPNEVKEASGDLEYYFGISNLPAGDFKITAYYQDLISNTINLSVSEPSGKETEVFELLESNLNQRYNLNNISQNMDSADSGLIFIIDNYPNSVYIPQIYELLMHNSFNKSIDDLENEYVLKFLEKYSNHFSSRVILVYYNSFLKRNLDSKSQIKDKLIYIKDNYKNTFSGKFAGELIKIMEKK